MHDATNLVDDDATMMHGDSVMGYYTRGQEMTEHDLSTMAGRHRWCRKQVEIAGDRPLGGRELGRLAGIVETHPARVESGRHEIGSRNVRNTTALAAAFGVSSGWLAFGEGNQPKPAAIVRRIRELRAAQPKPEKLKKPEPVSYCSCGRALNVSGVCPKHGQHRPSFPKSERRSSCDDS